MTQLRLFHSKNVAVYGRLPGTNTPRRRSEESFHLLSCVNGMGHSVRISADSEEFPELDMAVRIKIHNESQFYEATGVEVLVDYLNKALKPFGYAISMVK